MKLYVAHQLFKIPPKDEKMSDDTIGIFTDLALAQGACEKRFTGFAPTEPMFRVHEHEQDVEGEPKAGWYFGTDLKWHKQYRMPENAVDADVHTVGFNAGLMNSED